jgi:hypothetical protein
LTVTQKVLAVKALSSDGEHLDAVFSLPVFEFAAL